MSDNANQAPGSVLTWDEVKDGASEIFNVWVLGSEMQWAERAWAMLEKAGLTTYRDAVEETLVRVRLLALASLYWDFCRLGADEDIGWDELNEHATENLGIEPFRLAQVVGPAFEADDYRTEGTELFESALRHVIVEERPAIGSVVSKGYGDDWTFLKALFASIKLPVDPPEDGDEEPAADDEPEFAPAAIVMGWIMEGMPCR